MTGCAYVRCFLNGMGFFSAISTAYLITNYKNCSVVLFHFYKRPPCKHLLESYARCPWRCLLPMTMPLQPWLGFFFFYLRIDWELEFPPPPLKKYVPSVWKERHLAAWWSPWRYYGGFGGPRKIFPHSISCWFMIRVVHNKCEINY